MSKSTHGETSFDEKYYQRFFNSYNKDEFQIYENWFRGWERFIFERINIYSQGNVLEIGCSIGAFSKILKERGLDVTATDISKYILSKAKKLQKNVVFKTFDIDKTKSSHKYDLIFAFEVFEHLNNPSQALSNVYQLLNPGGQFIFSTPFPSKQSLADPTHINVHKSSWWLAAGQKVGFKKRTHTYATFLPFLYRYSRFLSWGFPVKLDLPYVNSTVIFFFKK